MKILVFTTLFPNNIHPNLGVFVKERMAAVARVDGCEVRVVAPVPYHPPIRVGKRWSHSQVAREEVIDGIPVYHPRYFMIPKISMPLHGLMMFFSVLPFVKRIRDQFNFDIIDAHYVYPDGFAAVLLGNVLKRPVVVSARGSDINVFSTLRTIRPFLKFTLNRARHIIAVSGALRQAITNLGITAGKISVIPNGVDSAKFKRIPQAEAREALGLPTNHKIVISVGGLNPVKGFDLLIRAFKVLLHQQSRRDYSLVIVGEGPMRKQLEELIAEQGLNSHVRLPGMVPHSDLHRWYSAADVFCLASEREGHPNVILEALACERPVVGAAVGGIPEILVNDEIGLLTRRDADVLASRIREAIEKQWNFAAIGQYAKSFTWTVIATKVSEVFDSVVGDPPSEKNAPSGLRVHRIQ